jgi:hypothetical protein
MIDAVAQPLSEVLSRLEQAKCRYKIIVTKPSRQSFHLEETLYVIRQQINADGIIKLVVAAKMGKEVF